MGLDIHSMAQDVSRMNIKSPTLLKIRKRHKQTHTAPVKVNLTHTAANLSQLQAKQAPNT